MKNDYLDRTTFSIILPAGLLICFVIFSQWNTLKVNFDYPSFLSTTPKNSCAKDAITVAEKQRGAHIFGCIDSMNIQPFIQNNYEWVTLVTWGNQKDIDSPVLTHHNGDSLYIHASNSNWVDRIKLLHSVGLKVFVKPHIWIYDPPEGKWRSDIYPANEENWSQWKESYRDFIIRFATIAEQANAEMFCVGAELSRLAVEKPLFWKSLIQEVRSIYSGEITYAANWYNEYEKITFWNDLDYIGIQAYFPLTKTKCPTVQQISGGWNKYLPVMESIHKKYDRKILFTEMGYKSTADSAIEPWLWPENLSAADTPFSAETQANCYIAFFDRVWKKDWFAGVHIWQLRSDYVARPNRNNLNFSPQGKLAESIIVKGFEY